MNGEWSREVGEAGGSMVESGEEGSEERRGEVERCGREESEGKGKVGKMMGRVETEGGKGGRGGKVW